MSNQVANKLKYLLATKQIDFSADTFKVILMQPGFVFNRRTHHGYADVSASELTTTNGYTAGGQALSNVVVTEDDVLDFCTVVCDPPSWTANGGPLTASGAIVFDDTPTTPQADPVVIYIDFGGDKTVLDGSPFTITGVGWYF